METLRGFPNLPAIWLRRAKPAFAAAINGRAAGVQASSDCGWRPAADGRSASVRPVKSTPGRPARRAFIATGSDDG